MIGGGVFRIYFGGGVGSYQRVQDIYIYDDNTSALISTKGALDVNSKISGIEGEAGIFLRLGGFVIHGGVNSIFSETTGTSLYNDAQLSIGFKL
jgi:hypothetical protein